MWHRQKIVSAGTHVCFLGKQLQFRWLCIRRMNKKWLVILIDNHRVLKSPGHVCRLSSTSCWRRIWRCPVPTGETWTTIVASPVIPCTCCLHLLRGSPQMIHHLLPQSNHHFWTKALATQIRSAMVTSGGDYAPLHGPVRWTSDAFWQRNLGSWQFSGWWKIDVLIRIVLDAILRP